MKLYFNLSELCIVDEPVPMHVADKLLNHHIRIMNPIRQMLGAPITASQNSGYRPYSYEKARGRSGKSQHTFGDLPTGKDLSVLGAIDWTTLDLSRLNDLEKALIEHSPYTRITRYKSFIHCDYKPTSDSRRQYFTSGADSKWTFVRHLPAFQ